MNTGEWRVNLATEIEAIYYYNEYRIKYRRVSVGIMSIINYRRNLRRKN